MLHDPYKFMPGDPCYPHWFHESADESAQADKSEGLAIPKAILEHEHLRQGYIEGMFCAFVHKFGLEPDECEIVHQEKADDGILKEVVTFVRKRLKWKCPHCGSDKGTWFDRELTIRKTGEEVMATRCVDCGKDIGEPVEKDSEPRGPDDILQQVNSAIEELDDKDKLRRFSSLDELYRFLDKEPVEKPTAVSVLEELHDLVADVVEYQKDIDELQVAHDKNLEAGLKLSAENAMLKERRGIATELLDEKRAENAQLQRRLKRECDSGAIESRENTKLRAENARLIQSIEGFEGEKRAWDKLSSENRSLRERLEKAIGVEKQSPEVVKRAVEGLAKLSDSAPATAGEVSDRLSQAEIGKQNPKTATETSAPTLAQCPSCRRDKEYLKYEHKMAHGFRAFCRCGYSGPWRETHVLAASAWGGLADKCDPSKYVHEIEGLCEQTGEVHKYTVCRICGRNDAHEMDRNYHNDKLAEQVRELIKEKRLKINIPDLLLNSEAMMSLYVESESDLYPPGADREGGDDGTG